MEKYGQEICLLDATYKTSRYSLPLFFVVVPTNTSYQIVATFLVSKETAASISEALTILTKWNRGWLPNFWMTDYDTAEMNAIEQVFPGGWWPRFSTVRCLEICCTELGCKGNLSFNSIMLNYMI